ncbi:MAG: Peptidase M23 [Candidatus Peregrinibacteria bacterium Gr01-1014_25]|nr:MAG: Peptidase M23 [Candidatus Peregrinibacteria bacterium Gr01-1014_25]
MRTPLLRQLAFRVRLLCAAVILVGGFFPPYVPGDAMVPPEEIAFSVPQVLMVEDGFLMKSSSLTQQGARRAYAEGIIHVVQDGESLQRIARKYTLQPDTIVWANRLDPGRGLQPGQELVILPVDGVLHSVARGQTLSRIADLYGIPAEEIRRQNKLTGDFIVVGQELIVPGGKPIVQRPVQVAVQPPAKPGAKPTQPPKVPPAAAAILTPGVFQMPCNCFATQYYHPGHYAVDLQTKGGGPVFAAEDGEVIRADYGWSGGYGNVVEIDHGNQLVTLYAHNRELYVKPGDHVKRGQTIAWMGNTGRVYGATGIHVHFEVRVKGVKKNPMLYLQ